MIAGTAAAQGPSQTLPIKPAPLPTDPAAVVAVVGSTPILWGEVKPKADAMLQSRLTKAKGEVPPEILADAKLSFARHTLSGLIQSRMLRESFLLDQVATQASDKRAEASQQMTTRARQMFRENELPKLLEQYETDDRGELDQKLRTDGSSLAARQNDFIDMMLGHMYMRENVPRDPEVSLSEIAAYYRTHQSDYAVQERARWEQLTIDFEQVPDRDEARRRITEMGRQAYFGGNLQAVAKEHSQDPLASSGGVHEWTDRGALASDVMDAAVFSLPLNQMSEIITDDVGMHIIRVLDRQPAGVTPLSKVQDEIRDKLKKQKTIAAQKAAIDAMQTRVAVWSLYPDDVPGARPLPKSVRR